MIFLDRARLPPTSRSEVSLTLLARKCYKNSPFVLRLWCVLRCTQTGASVPDAAKPQHFRLEVEARFRDSSRSIHVSRWFGGLRRRELEHCARPTCWVVNDLYGNAAANDRGRVKQP